MPVKGSPAEKAIQVLLVDDDEEEFFLLRKLMTGIPAQTYPLEWISAYPEALRALRRNEHDFYPIDYELGPATGVELIREAVAGGFAVPMILLTGHGSLDVDKEAMNSGAADFLVKGQIAAPPWSAQSAAPGSAPACSTLSAKARPATPWPWMRAKRGCGTRRPRAEQCSSLPN